MKQITLHLNGEPCSIEADACVSDLLRHNGLENKPVAVEVNHEIIPRSQHKQHRLHADDKVEIVHAIGGG
jgi:sulfur carrier protein